MEQFLKNGAIKGGTAVPGTKAAVGNERLVREIQAALMGRGKTNAPVPGGIPVRNGATAPRLPEGYAIAPDGTPVPKTAIKGATIPRLPEGYMITSDGTPVPKAAIKGATIPRLPEGYMIASDGTPVPKTAGKGAGQGTTVGTPVQAVIERRIEQGELRAAFHADIKAAQLDRRTARDALRTYDQLMQGGPANKRMAVQLQGAAVQAAALKAKIDADRNVTKTEALIRLKPLYAAMQRAGRAGDQTAFQTAREQYTQAYVLEQAKQQALSVKARSGMDAADDGVRNTIAGAQAYFGASSAYGGMPGQAGGGQYGGVNGAGNGARERFGAGSAYGGMPGQASGGQYGGVNGAGDGAREHFGARAGSAYSGILDQTGAKSTPIPVRPEGIIDGLQTALDIAGLIPVLGEAADGLNALISLARGNYADAALSAAAMLPIIGWLSTAGKGAKYALKGADTIGTAAKGTGKAVKAGGAILEAGVLDELVEGAGRAANEVAEGAGKIPKYPGNNPVEVPAAGYEWRGNGIPGSKQGNWYNPNTKEWLRPDLNHPEPIRPHWDYGAPDGRTYRIFPDGSFELK